MRVLKAMRALAVVCAVVCASAPAARALTISPLPGTPDASPHTQISFLGIDPSEIHDVSVIGSRSGAHSGRLEPYASEPGASFLPAHELREGEQVRVSALIGSAHARRVSDEFMVARLADYPFPSPRPAPAVKPGTVQSFASQPGWQPPTVTVTTRTAAESTGDVFFAPVSGYGQWGPMIVERDGQIVWFKPLRPGEAAMNFQVERYDGQPVLVWWQGRIVNQLGAGFGVDEIYNSSYQPVATVGAGNGYQADLHDIQLTPRGAAFITAYSLVRADLSAVGGSSDGTLQDAVVQEVDVKTGLVMWEWHAYGHVALSDSYNERPKSASTPWDYFHVNSISLGPSSSGDPSGGAPGDDPTGDSAPNRGPSGGGAPGGDPTGDSTHGSSPSGDEDLLISSRNTWAGYEVDHHTGQVLWRLGGKQTSFRMGPGTGTAWQHDMRWQPDGTITIFDDGDFPEVHPQSRAIRERIDWHTRTVSLIGRYVRTPALLTGSQGNDQVLPSGGSLVGWGEEPYITEFSPAGQTLFEAHTPYLDESYRAYTFPWTGTPTTPPSLAVSATGGEASTVYASWNGATDVSAWRVLAGPNPAQLAPVATAPRSGFQTTISVQSAQPDFAVQALGAAGEVLGTSAATQR